jgi:hypothetical protein
MNTVPDSSLKTAPHRSLGDARDPADDLHAALERALIAEVLASHGHTLQSVASLPEVERGRLMREAATAATLRLAEIEARAHYVEDIHED